MAAAAIVAAAMIQNAAASGTCGGGSGASGSASSSSARLFVSRYQKSDGELAQEEEEVTLPENYNAAERRRWLRWTNISKLYRRISREHAASVATTTTTQGNISNSSSGATPPPRSQFCSVEKALWSMPNLVPRAEFVGAIMGEFRFHPREQMDLLLHKIYGSFDGSEEDRVDVREVLGSLHILIHHRTLRTCVGPIVSRLYDLFSSSRPPFYPIKRPELLRLLCLPLITDVDVDRMTRMLDKIWPQSAPQVHISISRAAFSAHLGKDLEQHSVFGWLGASPLSMIGFFQKCAWERVDADLRIRVIEQSESVLACRTATLINVHKERLAQRLKRRIVQRKIWTRWCAFTGLARKIRMCRDHALLRRGRRGLRQWHEDIVAVKWRRLEDVASDSLCKLYTKKSRIQRLRQYAKRIKYTRMVESKRKPVFRVMIDAVKHLREAWRLKRLRCGMKRWMDLVWMEAAMQAAAEHEEEQLRRKVFTALWHYVRRVVDVRRRVEYEEDQRKKAREELEDQMAAIEEAVIAKERRAREAEAKKRQDELDRLERERKWIAQRALADRQAADRAKHQVQEEAKRQRALAVQQQLKREFDAKYDSMIESETERARAAVDEYFDYQHRATDKGADIVQKEFKELRARFYRPPRIGEEGEEKDMCDIANIVFVFIEVTLNQRFLTIRELFGEFDTDGSGYMSHDEFTEFMQALPVTLTGQNIRDIISKVDSDGDGCIDVEELESALKTATNKLGVPGSPWKMYVDPAQSVMCYHNVHTDEKVFDFKMTDPKLMEILHGNMRYSEPMRVRAELLQKKIQAFSDMVLNYHASIIQKQARVWFARKARKREFWKAALVLRAEREVMLKEATEVIRRLVLRCLARRQLRYLARLTYEKVVDITNPEEPTFYYFNHHTRGSSWTRPKLLRFKESEETLPWSLHFHPTTRKPFFYHAPSHTTRETKPDGYHSCLRCRTNLALRCCKACKDVRLCFACFRTWHLQMPLARVSRGDHNGTLVECTFCSKCVTKEAERSCRDCGLDFCRSCYARVHRSPLLAAHKFSTI